MSSTEPVTVTRGNRIRIVPEAGPERLMLVSHVEHHVIMLTEPCDCPQGMKYHAINCPALPGELQEASR